MVLWKHIFFKELSGKPGGVARHKCHSDAYDTCTHAHIHVQTNAHYEYVCIFSCKNLLSVRGERVTILLDTEKDSSKTIA